MGAKMTQSDSREAHQLPARKNMDVTVGGPITGVKIKIEGEEWKQFPLPFEGDVYEKRMYQWDQITKDARELFNRKNREYEDTIHTTGVLGAAVELIGVSARLRPMILHRADHGWGVKDALKKNIFVDILIYAVIALIMLQEDNWSGK
jgi:hypothetical protein